MKTVTDSGYTHAQLRARYFRELTASGMEAGKARKLAGEWAEEPDILVEVEDWFAVPEELEISWHSELALYAVGWNRFFVAPHVLGDLGYAPAGIGQADRLQPFPRAWLQIGLAQTTAEFGSLLL